MQPQYKLHHLGILCDDLQANVDFYTHVLGHQICAKTKSAERNSVWVGSGSQLFLELIGAPFTPTEAAWHAARGAGFHHLAFEVEDCNAAWEQLISAGLEPIHPPCSGPHGQSFKVWDDSHVPVEIMQLNQPLPSAETHNRPSFYSIILIFLATIGSELKRSMPSILAFALFLNTSTITAARLSIWLIHSLKPVRAKQ